MKNFKSSSFSIITKKFNLLSIEIFKLLSIAIFKQSLLKLSNIINEIMLSNIDFVNDIDIDYDFKN